MNLRKILGLLLMIILPALLWAGLANAQTFRSGEVATVPANETVNSSLFVSGRTIDIAGTVDGDVFCAGMNISVSGTVRGDVICAGQSVSVSGTVDGDVRLAGQTVTIGGKVAGNATVATSSLALEGDAEVGGDLSAAGTDLVLNGAVGRDVSLAGGTATLGNRIGRNVKASVENLYLRGQADIGGDLSYTSAKDAQIDDGAVVAGETKRSDPPETKGTFEAPYITSLGFVFYLIISLLVLSLAVVLLFPAALHDTAEIALKSPWKTLLVGLGAGLAVPILILILLLTIVGIPLALLLGLIWLVVLFLAGPFAGYYTGRLLLRGQSSQLLIMLFGSLIVLILLFIPILGFLVWLAVTWMGAGMILLQLLRRIPRPSYAIAEQSPKSKSK